MGRKAQYTVEIYDDDDEFNNDNNNNENEEQLQYEKQQLIEYNTANDYDHYQDVFYELTKNNIRFGHLECASIYSFIKHGDYPSWKTPKQLPLDNAAIDFWDTLLYALNEPFEIEKISTMHCYWGFNC